MILKALVDHYEYLDHEICNIDFEKKKPDLIIELGEDGTPIDYVILDKKNAASVKVPNEIARSSNPIGQLLYDKAQYVFGSDLKENSPKTYESQAEIFRKQNLDLIKNVDTPIANAFRKFLEIPLSQSELKDFIERLKTDKHAKGTMIVFRVGGELIQEDEQIWKAVCAVQEKERTRETANEPEMLSLISGEAQPIARTHPKIKGVSRDPSSLISYNFETLEQSNQTGRKQSLNAQIGRTDALKYTKVLNHLIEHQSIVIGEMVLVPFSEAPKAEAIFRMLINPSLVQKDDSGAEKDEYDNNDSEIYDIVSRIMNGEALDWEMLEAYDKPFYILGLSVPIKARMVINFIYEGTFGDVIQNVTRYYQQTTVLDKYGRRTQLSPSKIYRLMAKGPLLSKKEYEVRETEEKKLSKNTQTQVFKSILSGQRFPESLFKRVVSSIAWPQSYDDERQSISDRRDLAKIQFIKAFLVRNTNLFKGVDLVSLNKDIHDPAYLMGRLYAVLESTESKSEINPYHRYYKKAKTCPAAAYPLMMDKLRMRLLHDEEKKAVYTSAMKQIDEILDHIDGGELPIKLSLTQQGAWELGYHHQRSENIQEAIRKKNLKMDSNKENMQGEGNAS